MRLNLGRRMRFRILTVLAVFLGGLAVASCAGDIYQQRAKTMKSHTADFYKNLEKDRVAAAILDNEQIEAMAAQMEEGILKRQNQLAASEIDRDWMQVKAAREVAAENWLALAKYLVLKKRYDQARGTYQRVLGTYTEARYRAYAEQARAGLRDLDLILAPAKGS
jgi:hypothetical protein